jgi:hypothetical protein
MKVYISIPCADQKIFYKCSESLFKLIKDFEKNNIDYSINYSHGSLIPRIRNNETSKFLKSDCDYLLFIDSDIFNYEHYIVNILKDMVLYNYKIVGLSYPLKQFNNDLLLHNIIKKNQLFDTCTKFNINFISPNLKENINNIDARGYLEVQHLPTGCLLIYKDVLSQLGLCNSIKSYLENNNRIYNFFDCRVHNDKYLSEDYSFSQHCIDAGIKNYCFVNANLSHIGYYNYNGSLRDCMTKYYLINK